MISHARNFDQNSWKIKRARFVPKISDEDRSLGGAADE